MTGFDLVKASRSSGTSDGVRRVIRDMRRSDWDEVRAILGPDVGVAEVVDSIMSLPGQLLFAASGSDLAELYAVGGLILRRKSVIEGWMLGTDNFKKSYIPLTKTIKRDILPAMRSEGVLRLECHSIATHTEAHRWLELMGAECEGDAPIVGVSGETFRTYAWSF